MITTALRPSYKAHECNATFSQTWKWDCLNYAMNLMRMWTQYLTLCVYWWLVKIKSGKSHFKLFYDIKALQGSPDFKRVLVRTQPYLSRSCQGWLCSGGPAPSCSRSCTAADLLSGQTRRPCTAVAHRRSSRSSRGGKNSPELASLSRWAQSCQGSRCTWWQTTCGDKAGWAINKLLQHGKATSGDRPVSKRIYNQSIQQYRA